MAKIVLTNAKLLVNAVDLSTWVRQISIDFTAAEVESTAMGNAGVARLAGLLDWSMDVTFAQDWALSAVDATLFPLVGAAFFAVEARAVNSARSTTNPAYVGNGILPSYKPMGQKVGALAEAVVKIVGADGAVLQRLVV
jgi:hypothetical protein